MGIDAARHYFVFGMGAIAVAFTLHMIRSTILQKIYERSQQALKEARDQLETMSLTDGLTGSPTGAVSTAHSNRSGTARCALWSRSH
jgi:hypothetical protein